MFNSIDDFNKWIKLAKDLSNETLNDARKFIEHFPGIEFDDAVKVLEKLHSGIPVRTIAIAWKKHQAAVGAANAELDYKKVLTMSDVKADMLYDLKHGKEKGTSTYVNFIHEGKEKSLDNAWTWRLGEFNIWTGYSNEGKSQFLRFLTLIKAIKENWKFAFYAPEDHPAKEFFDDFIHTASGYSTDKDNVSFIGEKLYLEVYEKLKDYFYFVYIKPPKNTILNIFKEFIPLIKDKNVKACIIDPFLKITRPKGYMNADDKLAGYITTIGTDFAREMKISLHLVMHQVTPRAQDNGLWPKPTMYNIKGGGSWADGTDNILTVQRPWFAKDTINDEVIIASKKIKKPKLVGLQQEIQFRFNRQTNRFVDYDTKKDLFDFDKVLDIPRAKFNF